MRRTLGLSHVNLNVADLERSVAFYREVFGLEALHESAETVERDGVPVAIRQVVLTTPGMGDLLALTQGDGFPLGPGGVNHLGFVFACDADVDAAADAALTRGGTLIRRGERAGGGVHEVFAYVRDPDGYAVELATQAVLRHGLRAAPAVETRGSVQDVGDGLTLRVEAEAAPEVVGAIVHGVADHAEREAGIVARDHRPLTVAVRESSGRTVAGLNATTVWGWLQVRELWVAPALRRRGLGTRLMAAAEREAMARGCRHALLDTFDFQARPFYERLGYRTWGELSDFPRGHVRFFMAKPLQEG